MFSCISTSLWELVTFPLLICSGVGTNRFFKNPAVITAREIKKNQMQISNLNWAVFLANTLQRKGDAWILPWSAFSRIRKTQQTLVETHWRVRERERKKERERKIDRRSRERREREREGEFPPSIGRSLSFFTVIGPLRLSSLLALGIWLASSHSQWQISTHSREEGPPL